MSKTKLDIPSNVTRIARAIKPVSRDKIPQVVFYQNGVGSEGPLIARIIGGATAEGLSNNIREAYEFVCTNYTPGDEIFLIGFSRGAFTARSIASLIGCIGVLTKTGTPFLQIIFEDFEHRNSSRYRSHFPDLPFPNRPSVSDPGYRAALQELEYTTLNVSIKAVGVWDTVGSLGVPRVSWLESVGLQRKSVKEYKFIDTTISNCIENAFQALALDEHRASFSPAVWEKAKGNTTLLRQVWFPGVHSNVGGGYDDQELADITLAWMMAQLQPMMDFYPDYLYDQYEENKQYYVDTGQRIRPWSFGKIYQSLTGVYIVGGTKTRTPGTYHRVDPDTFQETRRPLRDTCEFIHPSVRTRIRCDGPGVRDKGAYECKALDGYKLKVYDGGPGRPEVVVWESRSKRRKGTPKKVLYECPLWAYEKVLLERSPKVNDYLMHGITQKPEGSREPSVESLRTPL